MWTYTSKNENKFAIPYSNIDHVVLSKGTAPTNLGNNSKDKFYHSVLDKYYTDELLTILYRKGGGYNVFAGEVAFNQLAITSEHKFVCDKD